METATHHLSPLSHRRCGILPAAAGDRGVGIHFFSPPSPQLSPPLPLPPPPLPRMGRRCPATYAWFSASQMVPPSLMTGSELPFPTTNEQTGSPPKVSSKHQKISKKLNLAAFIFTTASMVVALEMTFDLSRMIISRKCFSANSWAKPHPSSL